MISAPQQIRSPVLSPPELIRGGESGGLHVLLVEDDPSIRAVCTDLSTAAGCRVTTAESVPEARALVHRDRFELILLDLHLPGGVGAELFEHIRAIQPNATVVVMTAHATVTLAVDLMRDGASDFLYKPFTLDRFLAVLDSAKEHHRQASSSRALRDRLAGGTGIGKLIGDSAGMQKVFRLISKVAFTRHPVLIVGEEGTGKEAVARVIHANGAAGTAPFLPVDCSPIAPDLLERELFGVADQSGDARRAKPGLLSTAGHGTVLLDEVGKLPLTIQARLMRALEDKRYTPVGSTVGVPFEARILASSSANLQAMVDSGRFRKDLYYRLNVVKIELPPLRDRAGDVLLLADHFLSRQFRERDISFSLSAEASQFLQEYQWAGNVGELEHAIERACALASSAVIHLGDLGTQVAAYAQALQAPPADPVSVSAQLPTLQEVERKTIVDTLDKLKGDKLLAAKVLRIGRTTLYRKLKEYGIEDSIP